MGTGSSRVLETKQASSVLSIRSVGVDEYTEDESVKYTDYINFKQAHSGDSLCETQQGLNSKHDFNQQYYYKTNESLNNIKDADEARSLEVLCDSTNVAVNESNMMKNCKTLKYTGTSGMMGPTKGDHNLIRTRECLSDVDKSFINTTVDSNHIPKILIHEVVPDSRQTKHISLKDKMTRKSKRNRESNSLDRNDKNDNSTLNDSKTFSLRKFSFKKRSGSKSRKSSNEKDNSDNGHVIDKVGTDVNEVDVSEKRRSSSKTRKRDKDTGVENQAVLKDKSDKLGKEKGDVKERRSSSKSRKQNKVTQEKDVKDSNISQASCQSSSKSRSNSKTRTSKKDSTREKDRNMTGQNHSEQDIKTKTKSFKSPKSSQDKNNKVEGQNKNSRKDSREQPETQNNEHERIHKTSSEKSVQPESGYHVPVIKDLSYSRTTYSDFKKQEPLRKSSPNAFSLQMYPSALMSSKSPEHVSVRKRKQGVYSMSMPVFSTDSLSKQKECVVLKDEKDTFSLSGSVVKFTSSDLNSIIHPTTEILNDIKINKTKYTTEEVYVESTIKRSLSKSSSADNLLKEDSLPVSPTSCITLSSSDTELILLHGNEDEVQRIPNYEHYLGSLLAETDPAHPDYDDLNKAFNKVQIMVKERHEEISLVENEHKMESVQHRFPNDDLQLQEQNKIMKRSLQTRRKSAPGGLLLKSLKVKHNSSSSDLTKSPPMIPDQALASRTSLTHSPNRLYILEGPVQLTTGLQSQERYLFLFSDLLLIAKQKSSRTFKLKDRVRVCEIWLSDCLDDVSEAGHTTDTSFVVGWPTGNYVATFDDPETKEAWLSKLKENIQAEKDKEQPKSIVLKIINKDMENTSSEKLQEPILLDTALNFEVSKSITVGNNEEADEVVKRCMEHFHITKGEPKDYQLVVISGKEESPYGLIGHEHPYSIKMSHYRDSLKGDGSETPVILDKDLNDNSINCQIILRETKKEKNKILYDESQKKKNKVKKSPLSSLFKKRQRDPSPSATPHGKLFGRPLAQVFVDDNELPKSIYDLLYCLFVYGPFTSGIFRKPANSKFVRDLKEKLDYSEDYILDETNPVVVASTLKEYLRSLPDCLLLRELYPMWLEAMEMDNINDTIKALQHVFMRLPSKNSMLLKHLMCVLYHINKRSEENSMTAYNLAVCISQSLLWINITDSVDLLNTQQSEAMEKVPKLIQFMVDHCTEVFGEDTIKLFGDPVSSKQRGDSSTDSDSMNSILSVNCYTHSQSKRDDSSIDSLDHYSDSSPGILKTHLSPTNLSRDSGLFSSDNQLNELYEDTQESDSAVGSQTATRSQPPVMRASSHDPEHKQENLVIIGQLSHSYDAEMDSSVTGYPPKAPPRKIKKKSDAPLPPDVIVANQKIVSRMQTLHSGVELRTIQISSEQSLKDYRRPAGRGMPKRSTDSALGSSLGSSLGSVEESSETSHDEFHEIQSRHRDIGTIHKSESGAKLFLNENLIHNREMNTETYKKPSVGNHDSIQEERNSPLANIKRSNSDKLQGNYPPTIRHSWDGLLDSNESGNIKTKVTSVKSKPKFALSSPAESLDEETEDEVLRVLNDDTVISNTSTLTDSTPETTPKTGTYVPTPKSKRPPVLKHLKSQSLDTPGQDYNPLPRKLNYTSEHISKDTSPVKHIPHDVVHGHSTRLFKGMTSKGSDLFPTQVTQNLLRQLPKSEHGSQVVNPNTGKRVLNTHANKASMHCSTTPKSQLTTRNNFEGHVPRSAQLIRQAALNGEKGVERSSSDTRLAQQFLSIQKNKNGRPTNPPSYQEAIQRKNLQKANTVVVSDDQAAKQREASARARKLYEESQKLYTEEHKEKDFAYFSEPEGAGQSRDSTPVRNNPDHKFVKQPPSYEMACKRSEQLKEQKRSIQGLPPNYHDIKKNTRDSRETTPINDDRERTPTPEETNTSKMSKEGKRRSKSRERREGQRLSDTRLENNRRKKKSTGLSRSKSDSSEHLPKLSKLRVQDSTDSEEEWAPIIRTRRVTKSTSKERLNGFDIHKRPKSADAATLLKQLQESGMDIIDLSSGASSIHNRHTIRRNTTVKNKDWHKELAEKYDGNPRAIVFYQPDDVYRSQPKFRFTYNRSTSYEDEETNEESEKPKKRWVPPVHPSKDLIVIRNNEKTYGKDYSLNRSSSNVTAGRKAKPFLSREMRSNTLTVIENIPKDTDSYRPMHNSSNAIKSEQHNSNLRNKNTCHLQESYRHSDSPISTNSEHEDSDNEEQGGLTWSVSKLRNLWDNPTESSPNSHPPHFYSPNSQPPSNLRYSRDHLSSPSLTQLGTSGESQVNRSHKSSARNPTAGEHYI